MSYDEPLLNFAFEFSMRRYTKGKDADAPTKLEVATFVPLKEALAAWPCRTSSVFFPLAL